MRFCSVSWMLPLRWIPWCFERYKKGEKKMQRDPLV